ncbi:MAG: gluconokinase [Candidatus Sumerlaeia bacterium]|nr:gluconokinase [Candidatus Sumerlaeia bacterium]
MIFVVMGVAGCGKTTVGRLLAARLGLPFHDGDDYHPETNVRRMAAGIPLTDEDRLPWLERLAREMARWEADGGAVLACSALRESYRALLRTGAPCRFIHLTGSQETVRQRLESRAGHFMKAGLLESQFATFEAPEDALTIDLEQSAEAVVVAIVAAIGAGERRP